uniref:Plug domain-containing protein n=1 Tax=Globodera pallida TaxID=36090 RepID=A0A183CED6_GLOPA
MSAHFRAQITQAHGEATDLLADPSLTLPRGGLGVSALFPRVQVGREGEIVARNDLAESEVILSGLSVEQRNGASFANLAAMTSGHSARTFGRNILNDNADKFLMEDEGSELEKDDRNGNFCV